jgi:protocatechuate 3,4-dioxygenase beta subunit
VYGPDHDDGTMQCCYYQATVTTDDNGRFDIVTVKPSTYQGVASGPPAHIHFEILDPELQNWQAEFVFAGDPQLPGSVPQGMIVVSLQEKSSPEGPGWVGEAEVITPLGDQSSSG